MKKLCFAALWMISPVVMAQNFSIKEIRAKRIEITSEYDTEDANKVNQILSLYKNKIDSVMSPTLGLNPKAMTAQKPESLLSNWAADVMLETSTATGMATADMGLFNIGGLRGTLPDGIVRIGDIYRVCPFESYVVVVELKGKHLLELFQNIAAVGGQGVSRGVRMEISKDGKLLQATIGNKPIEKKKIYRIATIDYLAEGNDNLFALKKHKKTYPMHILARNAMMESIIKNQTIKSEIEGRIVIR